MRELKFGECRWPTQVTPLENGKPGAHIPCSDFKPLFSTTMQLKQINEYVVLNLDYYKEPIPS